jgi:tetratricopeptide (TPR) repeat protein
VLAERTSPDVSREPGAVVAGRYRVQRELARGAMGVVYEVSELSTGRARALKQLSATDDPRLAAMFEREYRTLASIDHPHIIEVHDYGVADGHAYYTMELLDGDDLRGLAPLPPRQACRYLRDVASSLALLHARRLLHRDISPRNVRAVGDGHCKLFDFGALMAFGVSGQVVGTPPCIPPEALRGQPLDQRADLYSLGALAYWLLTRRHAYHAKRVRELPERWMHPPPRPSQVRTAHAARRDSEPPDEPIPEELDTLVMALLSHDPLARPVSAAEVIERLNAIADLDAEPLPDVSHSYLSGAALVGRDEAFQRVSDALSLSIDGRGCSVVFTGPAGIGRTRSLGELAIQGQVRGAIVLRADGALASAVYGTVGELARQLLEAAPEVALSAAREHGEVLARVSDELRRRLDLVVAPGAPNETPGEIRKRTQAALRGWFNRVAGELPVVMLVDNLDRVDEPSAALLSRLARDAQEQHLFLASALDVRRKPTSPAAVSALTSAAEVIRLTHLQPAQTDELVRSLVGETPGTPRLSSWLHERSSGNPGLCITLADHLVQRGVLRHRDGAWEVPTDIQLAELPADVLDANVARLEQLGDPARRLYEGLCVARRGLPLELCVELAKSEHVREPFAALEELAHHGLIEGTDAGYRFASESLRTTIEARLDPERRSALHRTIGRHLLSSGRNDVNTRMEAGFHLLASGEDVLGADLLAGVGLELIYEGDELPAAVPALEAALSAYRRQGRAEHELAMLLSPLVVAGYHTDLRLAVQYGEEATAVQQRVLGLGLAARLRPLLGRRLSTFVGLGYGAVRHLLRPASGGVAGFIEGVTRYVMSMMSLAGAAVVCLDAPLAHRYAAAMEPLRALGQHHLASISHDFVAHLIQLAEDRLADASAGLRRIIDLFGEGRVTGITPAGESLVVGGAWYALGAIEGFRDGDGALRCADELEGVGLRLYDMVAEQVRANYHANRGEVEQAEHYRRRVEQHAIDAGTAWQAETWSSSSMTNAATITRDVIGIKRATQDLDRLSTRIPRLELFANLARSAYATMRGEPRRAVELGERVRAEHPPMSYIGWSAAEANLAWAYNELGEHEKAVAICDETLARLSDEELSYVAFRLRLLTHRAVAVANLGRTEEAVATLDALLRTYEPAEGPMTCGSLHEARALVALRAGDRESAAHHVERMNHHYRATGNPALFAFCQRFSAEHGFGEHAETAARFRAFGSDRPMDRPVDGRLDGVDRGARAERALASLVVETGAVGGYLFAIRGGAPELIAPRHGEEPPAGIREAVLELLERDEVITSVTGVSTGQQSGVGTSDGRLQLCVLSVSDDDDLVVAVAALQTRGGAYTAPPRSLLRILSEGLWDPADRTADTARLRPV